MQVSSDRKSWKDVECGKTFTANSDMYTKVINMFDNPVLASYVRLVPQTWYGWMSMRAGLLLCERPCVDMKLDFPMTDSLLSITKGEPHPSTFRPFYPLHSVLSTPSHFLTTYFSESTYVRPWFGSTLGRRHVCSNNGLQVTLHLK